MTLHLVTGAAGFIGSNIAAGLEAAGGEIVACDRLRSSASGKWRNLAKRGLADLVAPEALFEWLAANGSELASVVHMGAVSSTTEPDADLILATNFTLSKRLFDWCAEAGVPLIYASSAATYGAGELGFGDRDDELSLKALRPLNAYGWSKSLFDLYARRRADQGRAPPQWAGLKFFNVFGPGEEHKGGMRSVVSQIWPRVRAGEAVSLFRSHNPAYADGGQLRDFVYVKDVVRVVRFLLGRPDVGGIFNLGTGRARSFKDLALATFAAAGKEPKIVYVDTPPDIRAAYQYYTEAEMAKLAAAGWNEPFSSLEAGVADYVLQHLAREDPYP